MELSSKTKVYNFDATNQSTNSFKSRTQNRQFDFYGPGAMAPAPNNFGLSSQIRFSRPRQL